MFARGVERRLRPVHDLAVAVFRCKGCQRPLDLEQVATADVERNDHGVTGWVVFTHHCPCSPGELVVSRAWATHPAFVALFGSQPWLPYRAPFTYGVVADDEPVLTRWRWELTQMADSHEFLLFVDDALCSRRRAPGSFGPRPPLPAGAPAPPA